MSVRIVLSQRTRQAAKLSEKPFYQIALECGLSPTSAYRKIRGIEGVHPADPRYQALGRMLGVSSEELFEVQEIGEGV